jgi:hypothetical protein
MTQDTDLNAKQVAIKDATWKLIEDYVNQCRHPVNGPDPSYDAAKAILDLVIHNLVRSAIK